MTSLFEIQLTSASVSADLWPSVWGDLAAARRYKLLAVCLPWFLPLIAHISSLLDFHQTGERWRRSRQFSRSPLRQRQLPVTEHVWFSMNLFPWTPRSGFTRMFCDTNTDRRIGRRRRPPSVPPPAARPFTLTWELHPVILSDALWARSLMPGHAREHRPTWHSCQYRRPPPSSSTRRAAGALNVTFLHSQGD